MTKQNVLKTLVILTATLLIPALVALFTPATRATARIPPSAERPASDGPASPEGLTAGEWVTMREMMLEAQYQVTWQSRAGEWAYRAPNRAQGFAVAFAPDGFNATGYETDGTVAWEFGLALAGYGDPAELRAERTRVVYRWDDTLTEWHENSAAGGGRFRTGAELCPARQPDARAG